MAYSPHHWESSLLTGTSLSLSHKCSTGTPNSRKLKSTPLINTRVASLVRSNEHCNVGDLLRDWRPSQRCCNPCQEEAHSDWFAEYAKGKFVIAGAFRPSGEKGLGTDSSSRCAQSDGVYGNLVPRYSSQELRNIEDSLLKFGHLASTCFLVSLSSYWSASHLVRRISDVEYLCFIFPLC